MDNRWKNIARRVLWPVMRGWPDEGRRIVQSPHLRALLSLAASKSQRFRKVYNAGAGECGYSRLLLAMPGVERLVESDFGWQSFRPSQASSKQLFFCASLVEIPICDATFDLVLCTEVLEHIAEDEQALDELARVTAPEGWLLITVPTPPAIADPAHVREGYKPQDLNAMLAKRGFHVVEQRFCMHFWFRFVLRNWSRLPWCPRFLIRILARADRIMPVGPPMDLMMLAQKTRVKTAPVRSREANRGSSAQSAIDNQSIGDLEASMQSQTLRVPPLQWHIITCEYPPQKGGVSDYTFEVAAGLAGQGDEVHVWQPVHDGPAPVTLGVVAHQELGEMRIADLRRVGQRLDQFHSPRRLLVQWVPHGYRWRSMNLAFCWWLRNRVVRHGDRVELMVHETYLPFRAGSLRQSAVAVVHRLMTILLLRAPERVWISIPAWEEGLRPYALARKVPFHWLPIPSGIPVSENVAGVQAVRRRYGAGNRCLIGHFGTFGWPITAVLEPILLELARQSMEQTVLLLGVRSEEFRASLIEKQPWLAGIVHATGPLSPEDLSCHIAACDLLIQPYPDGVSSRRTSLMVGLSHGRPIVTTLGPLTEDCWAEAKAVLMAKVGDVKHFVELIGRIRDDAQERANLGAAAHAFYQQRFDIQHVIATLRWAALTPTEQGV